MARLALPCLQRGAEWRCADKSECQLAVSAGRAISVCVQEGSLEVWLPWLCLPLVFCSALVAGSLSRLLPGRLTRTNGRRMQS